MLHILQLFGLRMEARQSIRNYVEERNSEGHGMQTEEKEEDEVDEEERGVRDATRSYAPKETET